MSDEIKVVAWDFDGVLNDNFKDGKFIWADNFDLDIGQSHAVFEDYIFDSNFQDIITGREDIEDRIARWADMVGYDEGADTLLDYWFSKDNLPDPHTNELMQRLSARNIRQVIATNNEIQRARYIENQMGYGPRVEKIFASGRMGVAKPAAEFYATIERETGVLPGEILLIDDYLASIEQARSCGWQTVHFTKQTRDSLESILPL
ncbi:MAG: hypothetical protein COB90_09240 [Hyphomicrobiales bacterium]|nr:MAG: hypothetical protein COB90_09240 [Hyphomicrobiales bacterium]